MQTIWEKAVETSLDVTGTAVQIQALLELAKRSPAVEASEPSNLDASRALNVGIDPVAIGGALTFITLVFKTATAALEFMKAAREEIKARKAAALAVSDPVSGKALGKITADSSDDELTELSKAATP